MDGLRRHPLLAMVIPAAVMLAVPDAADRLNESSAVTLNGSGLLLVLCVLFMAAGLVLILRKK